MAEKPHNIVVCCDGTWCGAETGERHTLRQSLCKRDKAHTYRQPDVVYHADTRGNIQILADAFASAGASPEHPVWLQDHEPHWNPVTNTDVCYFNGVGTSGLEEEDEPAGLLGGFFDLLVYTANGALASDLPDRCKEAYRYRHADQQLTRQCRCICTGDAGAGCVDMPTLQQGQGVAGCPVIGVVSPPLANVLQLQFEAPTPLSSNTVNTAHVSRYLCSSTSHPLLLCLLQLHCGQVRARQQDLAVWPEQGGIHSQGCGWHDQQLRHHQARWWR